MIIDQKPGKHWNLVSNNNSIESIFVLKADHLGDLILATPAVYSLKMAFPKAKITLASTKSGIALYQTLGLIDDAMVFESPSVTKRPLLTLLNQAREFRKRRYDLIVNLRHDFRDILFASLLKRKFLCTYDHKGAALTATHKFIPSDPFLFEADNHLRLVNSLGVKDAGFEVPISKTAMQKIDAKIGRGEYGVIHPASRTKAKQWSQKNFKQIAESMEAMGLKPICVGEKEDVDLCGNLIEDCQNGYNIAGELQFDELFALLSKAKIFVGTDSFVMHCAFAVNIPGVAIFSGTNLVSRWAPPKMRVIENYVACSPCGLENCTVQGHPCMTGIKTDSVINEIERILERGKKQ